MANEKVVKLLARLKKELQQLDSDDPAALGLLESLENRLQQQSNRPGSQTFNPSSPDYRDKPLIEQLEELEVSFATKHPLIEQTLREIINTLGKMGI